MEVAVIGLGVKVGNAARELNGREDASALLGTRLLTGGREVFDGGGRILGNGSRSATVKLRSLAILILAWAWKKKGRRIDGP